MLGTIHFFLWELLKAPKIFVYKHFIWRTYRKGLPPFSSIKAFDEPHEKIYARHLLLSWYMNPNLKTIESDIQSIVTVRNILRDAILTSKIPTAAYNEIRDATINSHKNAWEIIIGELSKMTKYFEDIKKLVITMLSDSNQKIRETALLVMEDGKFSKTEKKNYYSSMLTDNSKRVRERAVDMIVRENHKFRQELAPVLMSTLQTEKDKDIIDGLCYALAKQ